MALPAVFNSSKLIFHPQPEVLNKLIALVGVVSVRNSKHYNPKFKWLRGQKVIPVKLPDLQMDSSKMTKEEIRADMKEKGVLPPRYWKDRPFFISSTMQIIDAYVPPEGDGKVSRLKVEGAKQSVEFVGKAGKSKLAIRKIKSYDEDFTLEKFVQEAHDIYVKTHEVLMTKDPELLVDYATENAMAKMLDNIEHRTIKWGFIQSLEPPRCVYVRQTDVLTKENLFAQATVRFHTQQMLAVYDRFGRLMYGSEVIPKDVLEYIVFEKNITNLYGKWRLHDKIIPDWLPVGEPAPVTYLEKPLPPEEPTSETAETEIVESPTKEAAAA